MSLESILMSLNKADAVSVTNTLKMIVHYTIERLQDLRDQSATSEEYLKQMITKVRADHQERLDQHAEAWLHQMNEARDQLNERIERLHRELKITQEYVKEIRQ